MGSGYSQAEMKKAQEKSYKKGLDQGQTKTNRDLEQKLKAKSEAAYYKGLAQGQKKINEEIKRMNEELRRLAKQRDEVKNPQQAAELIQKMKERIWMVMSQMKFPKNHQGFKNVIFIGRTSVGKSSLINTLFKTKLATSKGRCTQGVVVVDTFYGNVRLFDCQGFDNKLDITKNPELIPKYLGQMDVIYYLYEDPEQDIVKTCLSLKKEFYAVRTKCDPSESPEENTKLRANDLKDFKSMGVKNPIIFFVSKIQGEDNQKLLSHILTVSK